MSGAVHSVNSTHEELLQEVYSLVQKIHAGSSCRPADAHFWTTACTSSVFLVVLFGLIGYRMRSTLLRQLLRKHQREVILSLKDMDLPTMQKVLGEATLPKWLLFPDFKRVDWVNNVLGQLWPFIAETITGIAKQEINPLLARNRPEWIYSIHLATFSMGDTAPTLGGLKVYNREDHQASDEEISLGVQPLPHLKGLPIAHELSGAISSLVKLKAGIENLVINGRIRIVMKPLLHTAPIIGALQISFVEMPTFSFDMSIYGGNASFLPGLESWLHSFLRDICLRPYVLPEKFIWPIKEDADKPVGMLLVELIEAENVPRTDLMSSPDPYVRLFLRDSRKRRTAAKENDAHPAWNEQFRFVVHSQQHQMLTLVLLDRNWLEEDAEVGRAELDLGALRHDEEHDAWLPITITQGPGHLRRLLRLDRKGDAGEEAAGNISKSAGETAEGESLDKAEEAGQPGNGGQGDGGAPASSKEDHPKGGAAERPGEGETDKGRNVTHAEECNQPPAVPSGHAPEAGQQPTSSQAPAAQRDQPQQGRPLSSEGDSRDAAAPAHGGGCLGLRHRAKDAVKHLRGQKGGEQRCRIHIKATYVGFDEEEREAAAHVQRTGRLQDEQLPGKSAVRQLLDTAVLTVHISRVTNLRASRRSKLAYSTKVDVTVCGQTKSTSTVSGRADPTFDENVEFVLSAREAADASAELRVHDHHLLTRHAGMVRVPLRDVREQRLLKGNWPVEGIDRASIALEMRWRGGLEAT